MLNEEQLDNHILENYLDVTDQFDDEDHHTGFCNKCKKTVGFQIIERHVSSKQTRYATYESDFAAPYSIYFRCPICKLFKVWIVFKRRLKEERIEDGETKIYGVDHTFRVTALPSEGIQDIPELPETPPTLKKAYKEAIRCMDANCFLASAAMFRRALQIITREILGAKPSTLANEIKSLIGTTNKLGITLTNDFSDNSSILSKNVAIRGRTPTVTPTC